MTHGERGGVKSSKAGVVCYSWRHARVIRAGALLLCAFRLHAEHGARTVQSAPAPVVVNAGVPGENSTELRARFSEEMAHWRPRIVVLYTGMNDAVNDRKFVAAPVFEGNVRVLLHEANVAGATPLLISIQRVDERRLMQRHSADAYGSRPPNVRIDEFNGVLRRVAKSSHTKLVPWDRLLESRGGPNDRLSTDGVHLTAQGYSLLAAAVWQQLPHTWRPGATILCVGDSLTFGQGVRPEGAGPLDGAGKAYPTYPEQLRKRIAKHPR